jgi:hypothetical protein
VVNLVLNTVNVFWMYFSLCGRSYNQQIKLDTLILLGKLSEGHRAIDIAVPRIPAGLWTSTGLSEMQIFS